MSPIAVAMAALAFTSAGEMDPKPCLVTPGRQMMYEEFQVPDDGKLEAALGVAPLPGDEAGVRHLRLHSGDGCEILATTDALGRSVTVRVLQNGEERLSLFREGAVELLASDTAPEIVMRFRTGDTQGRLELALTPRLHIHESTLLN